MAIFLFYLVAILPSNSPLSEVTFTRPTPCRARTTTLTLATVNYQCIMVIATVAQDFLLLASAVLIGWYLVETRRMRIAAEKQVAESQRLVKASDEQLEAQITPAIAVQVRGAPQSLLLVNVGKGPALNIVVSPAERGANGSRECSNRERFDVPITFLSAGGDGETGIRTQRIAGAGGIVLDGRSLQCQYTSLSGQTYWTVVDFDHASGNTVESTRFTSAFHCLGCGR
jgi:hypothetical protein